MNSANPRDDAKDLSIAMYKSERRATAFRRRRTAPRKKTCWCAPRKAGSMSSLKSVDDPTLKTNSKDQRKDRKKVRKVSRKLRRIDVLARPKSQDPRKHSPSVITVPRGTRKDRYAKLPTTNAKQSHKSIPDGQKSKKLSKIMVSRKLQRRLISLVSKKIKELAKSKKTC